MDKMNEGYNFLVNGNLESKAVPCSTFGSINHDNSYIPRCIENVLGSGHKLVWEYNIPATARLLKDQNFDGFIIALGPGASSCLENIDNYFRSIDARVSLKVIDVPRVLRNPMSLRRIIDAPAPFRSIVLPVFESYIYSSRNDSRMETTFRKWLTEYYQVIRK